MQEFQTNKEDITQSRLIQAPINTVNDGEVLVKVDRFAFTANNITYAAMGEQLQYWQFFPPHGEDAKKWGIIPVWGFADVIESNNTELRVGERLFGYFPPANELVIKPMRVTPASLTDGSAHRAQLPPTYNMYQRVKHEPGYDRANDNQRMLLFPLHMASFCLYDLLKSNDWFGAEQVVIISASSKTSTGLAYGLADDKDAPHVIGLTSDHHLDFVNSIGSYDSALSYDNLEQIDASKPTVIVDMSANADLLSQLHMHLGDNMRYTSNVGLTHWDEPRGADGIIKERSHQFFAPSHMQQRMKEWGFDEFNKRSMSYIMKSAAKTVPWLKIKELDGLNSLEDVYQDICDGKIGPDEGLVVVM
ncbi:DUF2855 family protein [Psychrobacter sp. DAB_AL32B]|uniref:DUF2855 family protein n=1 Tax=Psychrobacter sp. DAB_AL32B TaxID=1028414 RepID=UPI000B7F5438|nr:DUF2855 family protein [Psychrobacter sp. DAB_AL32B]OXL24795.1 hypothetical protein CAN34_05070 [Psychrobacter sp. DAB_AL32B]